MDSSIKKPRLAITMGDAAGVGPEVIVRAWSDPRVHAAAELVVLGHPEVLRKAVALVGADITIADAKESKRVQDQINAMSAEIAELEHEWLQISGDLG